MSARLQACLANQPQPEAPPVRPNPSPLEDLAAFAIAFFSGVFFAVGMNAYIDCLRQERRDGPR